MRQAATKPTDNPWAKLDALMTVEPEPMGGEWFTVEQFAQRYGMSLPGAGQKLTRLHATGKLKRWKGISRETHRQKCKYAPK